MKLDLGIAIVRVEDADIIYTERLGVNHFMDKPVLEKRIRLGEPYNEEISWPFQNPELLGANHGR